MKKLLIASLVIVLALAGFACGGGGGGGGVPVQNQSPQGIWNGSFHSNVTNGTDIVSGVVTSNELRLFSASWGGQYAGTGSVSGSSFSGTLTAYAPWGYVFRDGSKIGSVTINGTVKYRDSISGTYSGTGDNGTFSLAYDSLYLRTPSLSLVGGNWLHQSDQLGTVPWTIDANGNITGSSSGGCVYSGEVSIVGIGVGYSCCNAYRISINISSCGALNGNDYNGLAFLDDTTKQNDTLIASVANPTQAFTANFIRQ